MGKNQESAWAILKQFFDKAMKIMEGQGLVKRYNFTFQFHVTDGEDFYLEVDDGKVKVGKGESAEKDIDKRTLLEGSNASFVTVFKGEAILWDEVWRRNLKAECYGPSQPYISWLSQFFKIGRVETIYSDFFRR